LVRVCDVQTKIHVPVGANAAALRGALYLASFDSNRYVFLLKNVLHF